MQREFGGYLPLELPHGQELYIGAGVLRLNCGRNAIVAALRDAGAKKVYLPYYNCNTVYDAVTARRCGGALSVGRAPSACLSRAGRRRVAVVCQLLRHCVGRPAGRGQAPLAAGNFDNTQAFFSAPRMDADSYNVYSCRKFVGVPDGAYLVHTGLTTGFTRRTPAGSTRRFCSAASMKA